MQRTKRTRQAGDWFAIPLKRGGFAVGLIARASKGPIVLGYFFGPKLNELPTCQKTKNLTAEDAILVCRFSHLALVSGDWPIICHSDPWQPQQWPLPTFGHYDLADETRAYRRQYNEFNLAKIIHESRINVEEAKTLWEDVSSGSGVIVTKLTHALD